MATLSDFRDTMLETFGILDSMTQEQMRNAVVKDERRERVDNAVLSTAETLATIHKDIATEAEERRQADEENMKYTKRNDRISLFVAILALLVGAAGFVVALIK